MKSKITDKGFELLFSFFAENKQIAYQTTHELIPQYSDDTDAIFKSEIRLHDPLPRNEGKSYAVNTETFSEVFFRNGETGFGVIKC